MNSIAHTLLYIIEGQPVPRHIGNDTTIMILMLVCFLFFIVALASVKPIATKILKEMFLTPRDENWGSSSGTELRFGLAMACLACLTMAIFTFIAVNEQISVIPPEHGYLWPVLLLTAVFMAYLLLKWLTYSLVNCTFFSSKKNLHWSHFYLQTISVEAILLFPATLLLLYLDIPTEKMVYFFFFVFLFVKILSFYKSWAIFFRQNDFYLQTFLYFCTLEIVPTVSLAGMLVLTVERL